MTIDVAPEARLTAAHNSPTAPTPRVPGTLIITEACFVSPKSRGRDLNAPGIYSADQVKEWARVCEAVHQKGSFIFMQLWHVGRAARKAALEAEGLEAVSSSAIPIDEEHPKPRPMTEEEIWECIASFGTAAKNAIAAGFDGVEVHGANGYLIDQFLQDTCNQRADQWGGSLENRSRFCHEAVKAVCNSIGSNRTGVHLSPFSDFQGMRMKEPEPQFTDIISQLNELGLAYLRLVEPRIPSNLLLETENTYNGESLDFAIRAWKRQGL